MTQSTPVANESGATTQPWRTPEVISNQRHSNPYLFNNKNNNKNNNNNNNNNK